MAQPNKNLTGGEKKEIRLRKAHKKALWDPKSGLISASLSEYREKQKKFK